MSAFCIRCAIYNTIAIAHSPTIERWHHHNLHTRLLPKYTTMPITHGSAPMLMMVQCMQRWLGTNSLCVGIGVCLNLNALLLGIRCIIAIVYSPVIQLQSQWYKIYGFAPMLILIEYIYGTVSCWISMNRKYVEIGACLNLNVSLFDIPCNICNAIAIPHSPAIEQEVSLLGYDGLYNTIAITYSPAIQLQWQWYTIYVSALTLMLIKYTELSISTNTKYVGIGACLNLNVSLLGIRCAICNTIAIAHSPAIELHWQLHTALRWWWWWLNIWNGTVLDKHEQKVRWYCIGVCLNLNTTLFDYNAR